MLLNFVDCKQHCLVIRYFKVQLNLFVHPVQEDSRAYDLTFAASYCCSCSRTLNNTKVLHENKCFDDTKQLEHSDTKILSVRHCFEGSNCKEFSKVALQLVFFSPSLLQRSSFLLFLHRLYFQKCILNCCTSSEINSKCLTFSKNAFLYNEVGFKISKTTSLKTFWCFFYIQKLKGPTLIRLNSFLI